MSLPALFAAIADDYTGGSDLAGMLSEQGVRTVQVFGLQPEEFFRRLKGSCQAVVLSLKSRSIPAAEARRLSLEAADRLSLLEPRQYFFKYCSTFDSTREGNIGPVMEALMERLGAPFTIALPALPVNQRTQYLGYLFMGGQLLSETHMRNHPITPMTEPNLVRHLQAQCARRVGLLGLPVVQAGPEAIRREMARLEREGISIALVDAVCDRDVEWTAEAMADLRLLTGGSALGMKLPRVWRARDLLAAPAPRPPAGGGETPATLILSGSCSAATLRQLELLEASGCATLAINVSALLAGEGERECERLTEEARRRLKAGGIAAIRSSAGAEEREAFRRRAQAAGFEPDAAAEVIEKLFGELAARLVRECGVRRLVVAGGETAGAVVAALGIPAVEITGILDPGVPSLRSLGDPPLKLALKSGNFGSPDFFIKAVRALEEQ